MEVLDISLKEQTVTVNISVISRCRSSVLNSNHIQSVDLGDSPFVFSASHNILNVEGCGYAAILNYGEIISGCSTTCNSDISNETDLCIGLGCCQTKIPGNLKSYTVDVTGLKLLGEDGACGSAFLGDESWLPSYNTNGYSLQTRNKSFFPVSLMWLLTENEYDEMPNCRRRKSRNPFVDLGNGSYIDLKKCSCGIGHFGNPYLPYLCEDSGQCTSCLDSGGTCHFEETYPDDLDDTWSFYCQPKIYYPASSSKSTLGIILAKSSAADPDYAKKGCNDTCGGVRIPYPFGIGANCSVNKWYVIDCNSSTPYLSAFNNMEVVKVSLEEQTVTVNVSVISRCQNSDDHIPSMDLGESPFVYSGSHNVLTVEGCGYAAILDYRPEVIAGCSTTCTNDGTSNGSDLCFGLGCCRITIPYNLKSYSLDLTGLKRLGEDGACGSAFLADERWLPYSFRFSDGNNLPEIPKGKTRNTSFSQITLMWFLTNDDFLEIPNCWEEKTGESSLYLGNRSYINQRMCSCGVGRVGNPYLHYQCEESEDCRRCRDSGRICLYEQIYLGNSDDSWWLNCSEPAVYNPISSSSKSPITGVIIGKLYIISFNRTFRC
ncbi:hypothetical protein M8C21_017552 [Ambrosia artemisiifolia]|uniref:Uncharacterized protein n=1 Tax=Ambrosia artemisiifolia TaxID=4212 RepID=A0AAD5DC21_AMBAR|nr:hypothetical protein M8C21_017552 [Ambrosia artemisiifolia]